MPAANLVEAVPMPPDVVEDHGRFIAEHHVERPFVKRRRDQRSRRNVSCETGEREMTAPDNFVSTLGAIKAHFGFRA